MIAVATILCERQTYPTARAAAALRVIMAMGKFQGVMRAHYDNNRQNLK